MYLVDTSVWIDFLRENETKAMKFLKGLMQKEEIYGLTPLIYQEILQGAKSAEKFEKMCKYFSSQHFFMPKNSIYTFERAAQHYCNCRWAGVTIRSTVDCVIAQIAIENDLILLHNDKDFDHMKKVLSTLRVISG